MLIYNSDLGVGKNVTDWSNIQNRKCLKQTHSYLTYKIVDEQWYEKMVKDLRSKQYVNI